MSLKEIHVEVPKAEAVAIEYPGFVRDVDKALSTLGGIDGIATAVGARHHLKLKLRPEDWTSHPLYGERSEQTRLLLRVAQPRELSDGQPSDATGTTGPSTGNGSVPLETSSTLSEDGAQAYVTASIVARVTPTFRFPGLADYAFIPHDPLLPSRTRDLLPYDQRPDRAEPTKAMQPFLLIPQLFSWLDLPQDYAFKQVQSKHHLRGLARSEPNWGDAPVISFYAEGVPPPVACGSVGVAAAEAEVAVSAAAAGAKPAATAATEATAGVGKPTVDTAAGGDTGVADVRVYRVLETEVSRLLSQRPVWGLELMRERCAACAAVQAAMPRGCSAAAVERVVQRLCYRFKTGPWRGLFIRRGFDPRADVEARKYQAITYFLPNNWYRNLLKAGVQVATKQKQQQQQQATTATTTAAAVEREVSGEGTAVQGVEAAGGRPGTAHATSASSAVTAAVPPPPGAAAGAAGNGAGSVGVGDVAATGAGRPGAPTWFPLAPSCLDDLHNFRALPTQQSVTFQLTDLQLKEVQEALQEAPPSVDAIRCSEKTGWFSNAALQCMQTAVQQRFLQLMDQLAPPGLSSSAGGVFGGGGGGGEGGDANGVTTDSAGDAVTKRCSTATGQTATIPASVGGDVDVDMQDAARVATTAAPPAAMAVAVAVASTACAADEALRALMVQMNLHGPAGPNAGGAAGLFGSDDDDDDFQLLDEQEGHEHAGKPGIANEGGEDMATAAVRTHSNGRAAAATAAAVAGSRRRGDEGEDGGRKGEEEVLGNGSDGDESAMESEYDIGMGEEDDGDDEEGEEEEEEEEEEGVGVGRGHVVGGMYSTNGAYGRLTVPFDDGVPDRRHDGGGMFGSEDDEEAY